MDELEESQVQRQLLLRDSPMGAEPTSKQRPEPFEGINVDFTESVSIIIPSILGSRMTDRPVVVTPLRETVVDGVFVGVHDAPHGDCF